MVILFVITQWITFLNSREVHSIASYEDKILVGTTGGALIFDKKDTNFIHITNVDGLLSNQIRSVEIDQYGNFWFLCEDEGITLMSYDLSRIRNFTYIEGLPSYNFSSIYIDGDTVWVGLMDGWQVWMCDMEGDPFGTNKFTLFEIEPTNEVNEIKVINDSLWFGTNRGIGVTSKNVTGFNIYNTNDGLPNDTVLAIICWNGFIWAGTKRGIARLDTNNWEIVDSNFKVYDFCSTDTSLWVACSSGVKKWNEGMWTEVANLDARSILFDGDLWIGTFGDGIVKYDGALHYYTYPSPIANRFRSIAIDSIGNLWAAHSHNKRVSKFLGERWKIYNENNEWGVGGGGAEVVISDKENNVWILMWDWMDRVGVVKIMPNDSIIKLKFEGRYANVISSGCIDSQNNLWVGCGDGCIRRISNDTVDTVISNECTQRILAMASDWEDNIWVGNTVGVTVFFRDGGYYRIPGVPTESVQFINTEIRGEVWVGTVSKVCKIENNEVTFSYDRNELGGITKDMTVDNRGRIWFAVEEVGIKVLELNNNFTLYNKKDGLVSEKVLDVEFDKEKEVLWVGTAEGLSKYTVESGISEEKLTPEVFTISECYPNPFSGRAFFRYQVPKTTKIKIEIYDISGRRIKTLVNSEKKAGYYSIKLDAKGLRSGIYFMKFSAGNYKETKKLILMQ